MPIPELRAPLAFAGDKPGPFAGSAGKNLRILVDLPASQRQPEQFLEVAQAPSGAALRVAVEAGFG